jgi:5S rRNA maturation endonuclease (ribonuclease M5)
LKDDGSPDSWRYSHRPREREPEIEYVDVGEPSESLRVVERDPLITYAERYGFSIELLKNLGIESGTSGTDEVIFTFPPGWRKIRHINIRRDRNVVSKKTGKRWRETRFQWDERNNKPEGYLPIWPWPDFSRSYESILVFEGETDCTCARACGFDNAFTYGSSTNIPGQREFAVLKKMGVERIFLFFDCDTAGSNGAENFCEAAWEYGYTVDAVNIADTLWRWSEDGAKDIRDIYTRVPKQECFEIINGYVEKIVADEVADHSFDAQTKDAPYPEWLLDEVFAKKALNLLVAPGKMGKTTMLYGILDAARDGGEVIGHQIQRCRVLLLSEMDKGTSKQYREDIVNGSMSHVIPMFFDPRDPMEWSKICVLAKRLIRRHELDVLIVDTANQFMSFRTDEINSSSAVRAKLVPLREFCDDGVSVIIVHHTPHSRSTPLGSVDWGNAVDNMVTMTRDQDDVTSVSVLGRFGAFDFDLTYVDGHHVLKDAAKSTNGVVRTKSHASTIIDCVPTLPNSISLNELCALFPDTPKNTIRSTLARAKQTGAIHAVEHTNPPRYYRDAGPEIELVGRDDDGSVAPT